MRNRANTYFTTEFIEQRFNFMPELTLKRMCRYNF